MRNLLLALAVVSLPLAGLTGCVRRTVTIDSVPSNALVWLNDREVGRTPVTVDFRFYGDYDVRLVHEDAEPMMAHGVASPPVWELVPLDLIAELVPFELHSRNHWHYQLHERPDDPADLRERAAAFRADTWSSLSANSEPENASH